MEELSCLGNSQEGVRGADVSEALEGCIVCWWRERGRAAGAAACGGPGGRCHSRVGPAGAGARLWKEQSPVALP